jgi:hypothetical protein
MELTEEEKRVFESLGRFKVTLQSEPQDGQYLSFVRKDPRYFRVAEVSMPRSSFTELGAQLEEEIIEHPTLFGFIQPTIGYAEIEVNSGDDRRFSLGVLERVLRLLPDEAACPHSSGEKQELPSLPFTPRMERDRPESHKRIHLASPKDGLCIELSNASPLGMLLYGRGGLRDYIPLTLTIKIDYGKTVAKPAMLDAIDDIVRSLSYELNVRNGRSIIAARRRISADYRAWIQQVRQVTDKIRYPETRIQHEAADLFEFASQAVGNPPLAFLSYYQALEYFMPSAARQSAIDKVRVELRDPAFDRESNSSLMRLLSAAESLTKLPEGDQLRILVRKYVRRDRLEQFFAIGWGEHFTSRGPIKGVENINLKNTQKDLHDQVADRIYQIRNRIVHAKDDRRYDDFRVLLPRSQEADSLPPDVELARFLASEAIIVGQKP